MRIATLCGMGFGTALMLKMFVEELLSDLKLKAEIIPWDLGSFKGGGKVDIIVASSDMEMHLRGSEARVILLTNVVNKAELKEKLIAVLKERGDLPG